MTVSDHRPAARILTICTGNVCRSPLIERLLQRAMDETYGDGVVEVSSAGTGALVGKPMDARSAGVLSDLGGSSEGFLARHLVESHVRDADLVITATRNHRGAAVRHHPKALRKAFTLRELALLLDGADLSGLPEGPAERIAAVAEIARSRKGLLVRTDQDSLDVIDPFRRDDEVYAQMRAEVEPALRVVVEALTGRRSA